MSDYNQLPDDGDNRLNDAHAQPRMSQVYNEQVAGAWGDAAPAPVNPHSPEYEQHRPAPLSAQYEDRVSGAWGDVAPGPAPPAAAPAPAPAAPAPAPPADAPAPPADAPAPAPALVDEVVTPPMPDSPSQFEAASPDAKEDSPLLNAPNARSDRAASIIPPPPSEPYPAGVGPTSPLRIGSPPAMDEPEMLGVEQPNSPTSPTSPLLFASDSDSDNELGEESAMLGRDWAISGVEDTLEVFGFGKFQMKVFLLCGIANFALAFETSMVAILHPVLKDTWTLTDRQMAGLGASQFLGMIIGATFLGRLADRVGRRPVFFYSLFSAFFFGIISAFATSIHWFLLWRFFLGMGYGGNMVVDVILCAEVMPIKHRGRWLVWLDAFFAAGALGCAFVSWYIIPTYGWRHMAVASTIPALLLLFISKAVPESPHYGIMRSDPDVARSLLLDIGHENGVDDALLQRTADLEFEHGHGDVEGPDEFVESTYAKLFNAYLKPTTYSLLLLWLFSSLSGTLFIYMPKYVTDHSDAKANSHMFENNMYVAASMLAGGDLIGGLLIGWIVVRIDRRSVLRFTFMVLGFGCIILGVGNPSVSVVLSLLPLFSMLRSATLAVLYAYTAELYPTSVRGTGLGLCSAVARISPSTVYFVVPFLMSMEFMHVTSLYATLYILAFSVTFFLKHDTRKEYLGAFYYRAVRAHKKNV
jgi:MFS transporter, putative metabolite:H+ symporter